MASPTSTAGVARPVTPEPPQPPVSRGRLRLFFGYAHGVGKTHAMLSASRREAVAGRDVVVAVAESHGSEEVAHLLEGLNCLASPAAVRADVASLDLDAALTRRPSLLVLDALARPNAPGHRHPYRWQDLEELLSAGIDVFATLDVQDLLSLVDVAGGILGMPIEHYVPDSVFDRAAEVMFIDLPVDELLSRRISRAGGSSAPSQAAQRANLIALRELALRRMAERVDRDLLAQRARSPDAPVWKTANALLACVGPGPGAERVVHAAARLARQLNTDWHALYVETPTLQRLRAPRRERVLQVLNVARDLGATVAVNVHAQAAEGIVDYARRHNLSKVVIGRDPRRRLWPWQRSSGQRLALLAPDIDLIEIGRRPIRRSRGVRWTAATRWAASRALQERRIRWRGFVWAAAVCGAVTLLCLPFAAHIDRSNVVALFILAVVLVAVRFGRGPAALAALLAVGAFEAFFVAPPWPFGPGHAQYLLTLAVTLAVGLLTGQLTAGLRYQARVAAHREERAAALYAIASKLSAAVEVDQIVEVGTAAVRATFHADAALLVPDAQQRLTLSAPASALQAASAVDLAVAQWAFDHASPAGFGTDTLPGADMLYMPLRAPMETRGVLAVRARNRRLLRIPEQRQLLETFAALVAIALERVHYAGLAQGALVRIESERLRNSLLSALSHDLRTPLTVLRGLAESLTLTRPALSGVQLETVQAIQEEARRMSTLVGNLLEMARIESGEVELNLQWQPLEEVVGSALQATRAVLAHHRVQVRLPPELPLLRFDALLIERVLVNLLENAAKYTPAGSTVRLSASILEEVVSVSIADDGPGLPRGREEAVFQKFTRGERESATPGVGLGLAICRAIIESHHGTITGATRPEGGAVFTFTLPKGIPPAPASEIETEAEEEAPLGHG